MSFEIKPHILRTRELRSKKFNAIQNITYVRFDVPDVSNVDIGDIFLQLMIAISDVLNQVLPDDVQDGDRVRISIDANDLDTRINLPFVRYDLLDLDDIEYILRKVAQSKKSFFLGDNILFDIIHVKLPSGGGARSRDRQIDVKSWLKSSQKVVTVAGDDYCLSRSLILSKAKVDGISGKDWINLRKDVGGRQFREAAKLCLDACVIPKIGIGCDFDDLKKFQDFLSDYQIVVVSASNLKTPIFSGPARDKKIYIHFHENHFDSLLSIRAFLKADYYCTVCQVGFINLGEHRCAVTCAYCYKSPQCSRSEWRKCSSCRRSFPSEECFVSHIEITRVCEKVWKCPKCDKLVRRKGHQCYSAKCSTCKQWYTYGVHMCFIQPLQLEDLQKQDLSPRVFLFFDLETSYRSTVQNKKILSANLCIASTVCDHCWDPNLKNKNCAYCEFCGQDKYIFTGYTAVEDFSEWLFTTYKNRLKQTKKNFNLDEPIQIFCFSHYGSKFDLQFLLKKMLETRQIPKIIRRGSKIIMMESGNVRFLDSYSFISLSLSKFGKTFDLEEEKGWFCHLFHSDDNYNYVGAWPLEKYYEPEKMSEMERARFKVWYSNQSQKEFNMKHELEKYCLLDVKVLLSGVMCFRHLFMNVFNLDPFSRNVSLSAAAMEIFRSHYLKPDQLAIAPTNGYLPKRKQSYDANIWLDYIEKTKNIELLREYKFENIYFDGYHQLTNTVYEYLGCYFHGCPLCYINDKEFITNNLIGKSMTDLRKETESRSNRIRLAGFTLVELRECDWFSTISKDRMITLCISELKQLRLERGYAGPLELRDAYTGGRTNALILFYEVEKNEKILYYDVNGLYAFIMKYSSFPIGQPTVMTHDFPPIENIFGVIYCRVHPPRKLYIPLLGSRVNGKLVFTLCRKCAEIVNSNECSHNVNERSLVGIWTNLEIMKAISLGYRLLDIYEIHHYASKSQLTTGDNGLFADFVNKGLKIKLESSDVSDSSKQLFVDEVRSREGIELDINNISFRPGLRQLGKTVVNALYGEFFFAYLVPYLSDVIN